MRLCLLSDIPDGKARGFAPGASGRDNMFVVRRGRNLDAYVNCCPHWPGTTMAWQRHEYPNHDGSRIVCSAHGSEFDIDTGICTLKPCIGETLRVRLSLTADDEVWLAPPQFQETTS